MARHPAGIQSIQIQLVSGKRRPPIIPIDDGPADRNRVSTRRRQTWRPAAHPYLPIRGRPYSQRSRAGQGLLRQAAGERQRTCPVRHQPRREPRSPDGVVGRDSSFVIAWAVATNLPGHSDQQRRQVGWRCRRACDRARLLSGNSPVAGSALPAGRLLAVAHRVAVSAKRPPLRQCQVYRLQAGIRHQSRSCRLTWSS